MLLLAHQGNVDSWRSQIDTLHPKFCVYLSRPSVCVHVCSECKDRLHDAFEDGQLIVRMSFLALCYSQ